MTSKEINELLTRLRDVETRQETLLRKLRNLGWQLGALEARLKKEARA